ncbi:hypothetical protein Tco_0797596 [Tanacetum coccineum]
MLTELKKQIAEEQTVKENMSIEEMRHEQQLVDRKIKEITNDLGIKRFRGEKIDEEYKRICEITIRKLKQDFNEWGSKVRKKEKAYEDEKYAAACRYMLSVTCDDEDDYIPLAITTDLPIEEPDNSLNMGDEHLDTIPATESDEVIKSSVENLVPIPSEFEGISDDTCDVPNCDDNRVNVESELVESLINRDTSIVYSSKIDPILEEFAGELTHIAPIPPGIVEADFDPNDDTSSWTMILRTSIRIQKKRAYGREELAELLLMANYTLPEYDSFLFEIEPDQEGLISIDNSNDPLLELPEFESFHFDPSIPRPPPEPPDIKKCFEPEAGILIIKEFKGVSKSHVFMTGILLTLLILVLDLFFISSFVSFENEDTIFDPGIST